MSGKIEARLAELGITLPPAFAPAANYLGWQIDGNLLYIAGQGPVKQDGGLVTGRVGSDLTVEEGYDAARHTALELVAHTKVALEGDLDRVKRWVKLFAMVNCGPDFVQQPQVINGASDVLVDIFGDAGRHARSAVGMSSLPVGISVEIEAVVEIG
ncbi:MAG: RidA family protein [Alphaproteobacteria bacterium]|nr:RidA family protein [Alphaproteobacteria bacterium]MBT4019881.1 RidA family protein [Alphaproteobacteria bacterium]MBT4965767.1 RidA family protein [Alphaproteobacteria bacterium]MBT5917622.1 RidA family protein [Alphaproteobacteria bacterium]MBT7747403.1 RidA family protein [Alphaproteobacteria bacterium]